MCEEITKECEDIEETHNPFWYFVLTTLYHSEKEFCDDCERVFIFRDIKTDDMCRLAFDQSVPIETIISSLNEENDILWAQTDKDKVEKINTPYVKIKGYYDTFSCLDFDTSRKLEIIDIYDLNVPCTDRLNQLLKEDNIENKLIYLPN